MRDFIQSLKADSTVPLEVHRALVSNLGVPSADVSNKPVSEGTIVADGKTVSDAMDGFVTISVNGTPRSIPYFN